MQRNNFYQFFRNRYIEFLPSVISYEGLNDKNVLQEIESLYLEKGKKTEANQVAIYTQSLNN